MLDSVVCRYEHFETDWYAAAADALPLEVYGLERGRCPKRPHRKAWEWCSILQALSERDMLRPERTAMGFAVGREPLPSAFAAKGVHVLGTDQAGDTAEASSWMNTNQHAASLDVMFRPELIERNRFDERVSFQPADMRAIDVTLSGRFDFIWSSCAMEHLGGLEQGLDFVRHAMALVKPGGVAVHTTEINVGSNDETLVTSDAVIYRKRDIEDLDMSLRLLNCGLARCDFYPGDHFYDLDFDKPPYAAGRAHVKLQLDKFISTSMVLIIRKGLVTQ